MKLLFVMFTLFNHLYAMEDLPSPRERLALSTYSRADCSQQTLRQVSTNLESLSLKFRAHENLLRSILDHQHKSICQPKDDESRNANTGNLFVIEKNIVYLSNQIADLAAIMDLYKQDQFELYDSLCKIKEKLGILEE